MAIENLMKRWGFVRLSKYGLVLTPEGRIMSLRPEVLDDGMGGKIVGWRDRDLAAAELSRFEMPAAVRAVASPVASHAPPAPKAIRVSPPVAASTISPLVPAPRAVAVAVPLASPTAVAPAMPSIPRPPAPPITRPFAAVAPIIGALAPNPIIEALAPNPIAEPEEDEWEWEIALARARTVEDVIVRPSRSARRMRADTVPPSLPKFIETKTLPMAGAAKADPISAGEWPQTEPLGIIDYNDQTNPMSEVVRVVRLHQAAKPAAKISAKDTPHPRVFVRAPSPVTVIPVPKLPRVTNQTIEPVVRTRFPSATPVPARTTQRPFLAPPPPVRPAEDDKTSPGMLSISAAQVVALPRIPSIVKRAR